jgi:hypothetical protein
MKVLLEQKPSRFNLSIMKKLVLLVLCLFSLQTVTHAQSSPWSIGVLAGGKTIKNLFVYDYGVMFTESFAKGQRIGIEVDYRTSGPLLEQNWGRYPMKMETNISSGMGGVNYQWFPFVSCSREVKSNFLKSLKLKTGVWYVGNPVYEFSASLANPVKWGSITFTTEEVGSVATTITTQNFQPYVGLGYDRFYVGKRTNLVLEGGLLYQGKPQVTMTANNMLEQSSELGPVFQNNLGDYQFIPFLQLQLQIRL